MKKIRFVSIVLASVLTLGAAVSCESFFNPDLDGKLTEEENYTERSNIYASFMGLYSLLEDVMPWLVTVSELRGNLLMPTKNAPDDWWDVYRYDLGERNSMADPAPLYNIVTNCNDFLRHTVDYNHSYPGVIPSANYKQMIGGAVVLRAWAYLNIGKLYGKAVYYDYSMTGEMDLSSLPVLSFDELVPELIYFILTGVDGVSGNIKAEITEILGTSGIWTNQQVSADCLLTELYLWNKDYESAAKRGINAITGQSLLVAGDNHRFTCSYQFGASNGMKKWFTLWTEETVSVHTKEGISIAVYNQTLRQINPLYSYSSNDPSCEYLFKPTNILVNKFTGSDYRESSGANTDYRGPDNTYATVNGELVLNKYIKSRDLQKQDSPIYIYRTAEMHLMIAEALAGIGNYDAADAIINVGFNPYWKTGSTFSQPFDAPIYAFAKLQQGRGVRGRVDAPALNSSSTRFNPYEPDTDSFNNRRREVLDSLIIEEYARELAGEGKCLFANIRIARNDEKPEMVADRLCMKFSGDRQKAVREMMMDEKNWFIDYDLEIKK